MENSEQTNVYVWGMDLSLSSTGITIYDLEKREVVYVGSFQTGKIKAKKNRYLNGLRLRALGEWIIGLRSSYPPMFVGIEGTYIDPKRKMATEGLLRAHGMVNYIFYDQPQEYYPPKTVKAEIIHGNATKEDIQNVIIRYFPNVSFTNEDESDSFSVMLTVLIQNGLIEWEKPYFAEIIQLRKKKG